MNAATMENCVRDRLLQSGWNQVDVSAVLMLDKGAVISAIVDGRVVRLEYAAPLTPDVSVRSIAAAVTELATRGRPEEEPTPPPGRMMESALEFVVWMLGRPDVPDWDAIRRRFRVSRATAYRMRRRWLDAGGEKVRAKLTAPGGSLSTTE